MGLKTPAKQLSWLSCLTPLEGGVQVLANQRRAGFLLVPPAAHVSFCPGFDHTSLGHGSTSPTPPTDSNRCPPPPATSRDARQARLLASPARSRVGAHGGRESGL